MRNVLKISWLSLFLIALSTCSEAKGQADYIFLQTFYVVDETGEQVNDVTIEGVSERSDFDFTSDFKSATTIVKVGEHRAYVLVHGLCSRRHKDVVLRISAPQFESTEQKLSFVGDRAYVITLKRKGNKEQATISEIQCDRQPSRCLKELPAVWFKR